MKMLIGGEWIEKKEKIEVLNPYDQSVVDTVPRADAKDLDRAINSAQIGLKEISTISSYDRSQILSRAADLIRKRADELATTMSKEVGKTLKEAKGEVSRAVQTITLSSEEAKRIYGETIPFDAAPGGQHKMGFAMRVPVGVIAAINPFNFPLNLVCHKVGPALAAGNSVILKPASATPLSALLLAEVLLEAGLPPNCLNVITGSGGTIGIELVRNENVRMVTFTGSLEVGKDIAANAGLKKLTMELGSNSCCIVMNDANLERAAERIRIGGYALAGQVCISVQRVLVQEDVFEGFLDMLKKEVQSIKTGNPLDDSTDMGPMIDEASAARVQEWVGEAKARGAKIVMGGNRVKTIFEPTILRDVSRDCKVWFKEAFAPLIVVNPFKTLDEAIEAANDSEYGLQAGIFTKDLKSAFEAAKRIEVGGIMINEIPTYRADLMPYGGVKGSGLGREGPRYAVQEMTEIRVVGIDLQD
ncbi:aldehyde dehydrogenase family protein [candidate division TA06 bacterium]|uniref:Aldehyde dehydrogenase family protein n=1 Tax=candidate division TA06 bacterium TaxID=2250710 RepID=A0A523UZ06_UNCT6|nr:MAG: aldehyde dehydrogenase family protein [candidate division TA06 bacterium]